MERAKDVSHADAARRKRNIHGAYAGAGPVFTGKIRARQPGDYGRARLGQILAGTKTHARDGLPLRLYYRAGSDLL